MQYQILPVGVPTDVIQPLPSWDATNTMVVTERGYVVFKMEIDGVTYFSAMFHELTVNKNHYKNAS